MAVADFPVRSRLTNPDGSDEWESEVIEAGRCMGRSLRVSEADTGERIWSWSRDDGTGPVFLTRRVALTWMADLLERSDRHDIDL